MLTSLLLLLASPDADPANAADLKCLAVISAMVAGVPVEQRPGMVGGIMLFYGRILGRTPDYPLEAEMQALQDADPDGKTFEAARPGCGEELKKQSTRLAQLANSLQVSLPPSK